MYEGDEVRLDGRCGGVRGQYIDYYRGMKVEAARQCAEDRIEWRVLVHMYVTE